MNKFFLLSFICLTSACESADQLEGDDKTKLGELESTRIELLQRVAALENDRVAIQSTLDRAEKVLALLSVNEAGDLVVSGANFQVISGEGATPSRNGKGNLIVGYNYPSRRGRLAKRTGSHNLIVGDGHEYTASAGIVAGVGSSIMGDNAVAIGSHSTAGESSTVVGGDESKAMYGASNFGGHGLKATFPGETVTGFDRSKLQDWEKQRVEDWDKQHPSQTDDGILYH